MFTVTERLLLLFGELVKKGLREGYPPDAIREVLVSKGLDDEFARRIIEGHMGDLEIMSAPDLPQGPLADVVLCLGDSLTFGWPPKVSYPMWLQNLIDEQGYHCKVVNAGVNGETTASGWYRLQRLLHIRPAIAIVALGTNDACRGLDLHEMKQNLAKMLDCLQHMGTRPILASMRLSPGLGSHSYRKRFAAVYEELAQEKGVVLVPFVPVQVADNPDIYVDYVHLNAAGYRQVLASLWSAVRPLLS
ncbi:MAG: arylesterase [Magnetococcales bacterium]|nr:arylesterase [Magnetococcales bacterium]